MRDQARMLRSGQKLSGVVFIGALRNGQVHHEMKLGELGGAIDAVDGSSHNAAEREPRQPRDRGDRSKRQHVARRHRRYEQRFGRPAVSGPIELRRRRGTQCRQSIAVQRDVPSKGGTTIDCVFVREGLHDCSRQRLLQSGCPATLLAIRIESRRETRKVSGRLRNFP